MTTANMTKQELVAECEARGLDTTGTKDVLSDRIAAFDTAADLAESEDGTVVDGDAVEVDEQGDPVPDDVASMEVAVIEEREKPVPAPTALPSPGEWEASMAIAQRIANTPFVPVAYRGQPEAVLAAILYGREIGIGPMQALQKIHMIDGKPSMSAELMLTQMRRGGVVLLDSGVNDERAWIRARRQDTGEEASVEWTLEEAKGITTKERGQTITLDQKSTWRNYRSDMLWARCVGRLGRRLAPDLLGGIAYSSEEMADWDDGGYGGGGYDTALESRQHALAAKPLTSSKGVELRADAPREWSEIAERLAHAHGLTADGDDKSWATWITQAIQALTGKQSVRELAAGDEYQDTFVAVANGVANLVETLAGREMPPATRAEVQAAFAHANSVDVKLLGPDGPMDPDEAAMMQAAQEGAAARRAAGGAEAPADAQGDAGATDAPSGDPDAPLGPTPPPVDQASLPEFGEK